MRKGNWIWDTVWLWPVQCGVCAHSLPLVCASGRVVWFLGGAHILSWLLTNFFFFSLVLCRDCVPSTYSPGSQTCSTGCSLNKNNYLHLITSPKGSKRKWKQECLDPETFSNRLWAPSWHAFRTFSFAPHAGCCFCWCHQDLSCPMVSGRWTSSELLFSLLFWFTTYLR